MGVLGIIGIVICVGGGFLIFNYLRQKKKMEAISGIVDKLPAITYLIFNPGKLSLKSESISATVQKMPDKNISCFFNGCFLFEGADILTVSDMHKIDTTTGFIDYLQIV